VISSINTQNNRFSFRPTLLEVLPHSKLKCAKLAIPIISTHFSYFSFLEVHKIDARNKYCDLFNIKAFQILHSSCNKVLSLLLFSFVQPATCFPSLNSSFNITLFYCLLRDRPQITRPYDCVTQIDDNSLDMVREVKGDWDYYVEYIFVLILLKIPLTFGGSKATLLTFIELELNLKPPYHPVLMLV